MSLADKRMNLQYFRSDPADIWIWINPEVWIRIPDHILTLAGMGKGWPSRSELLLVVIQSWIRIPDHFFVFFHRCRKGILGDNLLAFLRYLAKWLTPIREWIHNILGPNHILGMAEFALSECSRCWFCFHYVAVVGWASSFSWDEYIPNPLRGDWQTKVNMKLAVKMVMCICVYKHIVVVALHSCNTLQMLFLIPEGDASNAGI